MSRGGISQRTSVGKGGRDPTWPEGGELIEMTVDAPESERIKMTVMEADLITDDDFLGEASIDVAALAQQVRSRLVIIIFRYCTVYLIICHLTIIGRFRFLGKTGR